MHKDPQCYIHQHLHHNLSPYMQKYTKFTSIACESFWANTKSTKDTIRNKISFSTIATIHTRATIIITIVTSKSCWTSASVAVNSISASVAVNSISASTAIHTRFCRAIIKIITEWSTVIRWTTTSKGISSRDTTSIIVTRIGTAQVNGYQNKMSFHSKLHGKV